jgi:hypothetical protein
MKDAIIIAAWVFLAFLWWRTVRYLGLISKRFADLRRNLIILLRAHDLQYHGDVTDELLDKEER